jgi:hypothetical protein
MGVQGVQGYGPTAASSANAGTLYYDDNSYALGADEKPLEFGATDLTGSRFEYFNAHSSDIIIIEFLTGTTVNGVAVGALGAEVIVDTGEHVTVMGVGLGKYVVWYSIAPTVTDITVPPS